MPVKNQNFLFTYFQICSCFNAKYNLVTHTTLKVIPSNLRSEMSIGSNKHTFSSFYSLFFLYALNFCHNIEIDLSYNNKVIYDNLLIVKYLQRGEVA